MIRGNRDKRDSRNKLLLPIACIYSGLTSPLCNVRKKYVTMKTIAFVLSIAISVMIAFNSLSYAAAEANPIANAVSFILNAQFVILIEISFKLFQIVQNFHKITLFFQDADPVINPKTIGSLLGRK